MLSMGSEKSELIKEFECQPDCDVDCLKIAKVRRREKVLIGGEQ